MKLNRELLLCADNTVVIECEETWAEGKKHTEEDMIKIMAGLKSNNFVQKIKKHSH